MTDTPENFEPAILTPEENEVMAHLTRAYNGFLKLPVAHTHDEPEFVLAINAAQNIILARVGLRSSRLFGER